MKITHQNQEVTRRTICQYHDISIVDLQHLIKESSKSFTLDSLVYDISRSIETRSIGDFNIEIISVLSKPHSFGKFAKYFVGDHSYAIKDLVVKFGISYYYLKKTLYMVDKFSVDDDIYVLKRVSKSYDLEHPIHKDVKDVGYLKACKVSGLTKDSLKTYADNGWYTKSGWMIRSYDVDS